MKEWVKKLDYDRITFLAQKQKDGILEDIPPDIDNRIYTHIRDNQQSFCKEKKFRIPAFYRYALAAGIVFIFMFPVLFFFLNRPLPLASRLLLNSGRGYHIRDNETQLITGPVAPKTGDIFFTEGQSGQVLQFGNDYLIQLNENTKIALSALNEKRIKLTLDYGSILIRSIGKAPEEIQFSVITHDISSYFSRVTGSFYYEKDTIEIAVYSGTVEGTRREVKGSKVPYTVYTGEYMAVTAGEPIRKDSLTPQMHNAIAEFLKFDPVEIHEESAVVSVITEMDSVTLKINGITIGVFNRQIIIQLSPGEYIMRLEKESYSSYVKVIYLENGEVEKVTIPYLERIQETDVQDQKEESGETGKELQIRLFFSFTGQDLLHKKILGFCADDTYCAGLTKTSVFGMTMKQSVTWRKTYGDKERLVFDTVPVMYNHRIYIAANYRILVLDAVTGDEITSIPAPGVVSDGYRMLVKNSKAFIPYPEGIYILDLERNKLGELPSFIFENPATPLLYNNTLYISSFVKSRIACFDLTGNMKNVVLLDHISICSPVAGERHIYSGDMSGTVYQFDHTLKPVNTLKLESGITDILCYGKMVFVFTNAGILYFISEKPFEVRSAFPVDRNPDGMVYLFKKPVLYKQYVAAGTDSGEIRFFDKTNGKEKKILRSGGSAVSSLFEFKEVLFTGTADGEIFVITYE